MGFATYSMLTFGHRSSWKNHEPGNLESDYKKEPFWYKWYRTVV